ncbi:MAG: hypothetical protein AAF843_20365 [Bacteroidota bacterium]
MKNIVTLIFLLITTLGISQTLDEQFKQLRDESETFKVYKVIKQTELNSFWSVVSDSVDHLKNTISESMSEVTAQNAKINQQEQIITAKDSEIESLTHDTTHISVLGMSLFKDAYIATNFSIIGLLLILLVLLFLRLKNSQLVARQKIAEWKKLNDDHENLKKESLEKQMKLRRELQTQVNKLNEIRST